MESAFGKFASQTGFKPNKNKPVQIKRVRELVDRIVFIKNLTLFTKSNVRNESTILKVDM